MEKQKVLAFALSLALSGLPLSAPAVLAADTTVTDGSTVTDTTAGTGTTAGTDTTVGTDTTAGTGTTTGTDTTGTTDSTDNTGLEPVVDENGDPVDPGVLPDSPFYWLTQLIDKLQVILTTDPVAKADLLEDQALEKMAEAVAVAESGDMEEPKTAEAVEEAMDGYTQKLAEAQAFLDGLKTTDSETLDKLETALSQTHAKNIQTLGGLLDKLPPQASEKVALNIVRSMEKSIAKMEKKDQKELAKTLRKATENIDEAELTEEDQANLEELADGVVDDGNPDAMVAASANMTFATMSTTEENKGKSNRQVKELKVVESEPAEQEKGQEQAARLVKDNQQSKEIEQKQMEPEQKQAELKEDQGKGQDSKVSKEKNQNSEKAQHNER